MAKPKPGDLVRITFTGLLESDQSIFESTDEKIARAAGIHNLSIVYGPRLVLFGRGFMIPGLEEGLAQMEAGQAAKLSIPFSKAFGPRLPDLVRVMNEKQLVRSGVRPFIGQLLNIDGVQARVKSVSSGRVVLDFNHPLAEQNLVYHIELKEVISEPEAKAKALGDDYHTSLVIRKTGNALSITIPKLLEPSRARGLATQLKASLGDSVEVLIEA